MAADDVQPTAPNPEAPPLPPAPPPPLRPENRASALEEIRQRADTVWTHADGPRGGRGNGAGRGAGNGHGGHAPLSVTRREDLKGKHGRVAVVDGCRTPFSRWYRKAKIHPRRHASPSGLANSLAAAV